MHCEVPSEIANYSTILDETDVNVKTIEDAVTFIRWQGGKNSRN